MNERIDLCNSENSHCENGTLVKWFVYIVRTHCDTLYTGITTDVERRFGEHVASFNGVSKKGAKYFRGRKPKELVYTEPCENRSMASKRECEIKKMNTLAKKKLIERS